MAALTADKNRRSRGSARHLSLPVDGGSVIYKGAIVAIDANGYAIPASDAAGLQVAGIAYEKVDNSAGANGAKRVRVEFDAEFLMDCASITQAMVGDLMEVVDDQTVDDAAGAGTVNNINLGRLTEFVSATSGWVFVPGISTL